MVPGAFFVRSMLVACPCGGGQHFTLPKTQFRGGSNQRSEVRGGCPTSPSDRVQSSRKPLPGKLAKRLFSDPPCFAGRVHAAGISPSPKRSLGEGRTSEARFGEGRPTAPSDRARSSRKTLPGKLAKRLFSDPPCFAGRVKKDVRLKGEVGVGRFAIVAFRRRSAAAPLPGRRGPGKSRCVTMTLRGPPDR